MHLVSSLVNAAVPNVGRWFNFAYDKKKNNSAALRDKRLMTHEISSSECYQPML